MEVGVHLPINRGGVCIMGIRYVITLWVCVYDDHFLMLCVKIIGSIFDA